MELWCTKSATTLHGSVPWPRYPVALHYDIDKTDHCLEKSKYISGSVPQISY